MAEDTIREQWRAPLANLAYSLDNANLVVVAGAGISVPSKLPTWDQLCHTMLDEMGYGDKREHDGPFVAQLYEKKFGREGLIDLLHRLLSQGLPSSVHESLARLPISEFYTTNYDTLIETALRQAGKTPLVISDESAFTDIGTPSVDAPAVVKLMGGIELPESIVVTSSDIADYSCTRSNLMERVNSQFKVREVLFLGVSFGDPWLRHIRDKSRADLRGKSRRRYVLLRECDELARDAYGSLGLEVVTLGQWEALPEFLEKLQERAEKARARSNLRREITVDADRGLLIQIQQLTVEKWQTRLQGIVDKANSGCRFEALDDIRKLLEEMAGSDAGSELNDTIAVAHRVAAQIALADRTSDGLSEAEQHIQDAECLVGTTADSASIARVRAEWHIAKGEIDKGLATLRGLTDSESRLALFRAYVETADREGCRQMVDSGEVDLSKADEDENIAQAAALYYGLLGDICKAKSNVDLLLEKWTNGRNLQTAAMSLRMAALASYHMLCGKYHLPLGVPVFFRPDKLRARKLQEDAADHLMSARRWYLNKGATKEAELIAQELLRIAIGRDKPDLAAEVLEAVPDKGPERVIAAARWPEDERFATQIPSRTELENALQRGEEPTDALFEWTTAAMHAAGEHSELARVLWVYRDAFRDDVLTHLDWARSLSQLCREAQTRGEPVRVNDKVLTPFTVIAELRPPAEFEWFQALLECQTHLAATLRSPDVLAQAQAALTKAKDLALEDNPEVLLAGYYLAYDQKDYAMCLEKASRLVDIVRTEQAVKLMLEALLLTGQWRRFLQELGYALDGDEMEEDNAWVRGNRAAALVNLDEYDEAVGDLRWVFEYGEGGQRVEQAVSNLTYIYRLRGDYQEARQLLEQAHDKLGSDKPDFLIGLAYLLIDTGRADEAFEVLKAEADRFAGNRVFDVALQLTAFHSSHEDDPVAREAGTRVFAAPDDEYVRRIQVPMDGDLGEVGELFRQQAERARIAETGYVSGKLPFVALACSPGFRRPVCELWWTLGRNGVTRYVSLGNRTLEIAWLTDNAPAEVVMDYTTLLLLDEIVPDDMGSALDFAGRFFKKIYVPERLRPLLTDEESALARAVVQPSRSRRADEILRRLRGSAKLIPIGRVDGEHDPTGEIAARRYAAENELVFVTAYGTHDPQLAEQAISVGDFVRWLRTMGAVGAAAVEELTKHQLGKVPGEAPKWDQVRSSREVVMDDGALAVLFNVGTLDRVLDWVETLHVPEINIERFEDMVNYTQWVQECQGRFNAMRRELKRRSDLVEWVSLTKDDRQLKHEFDKGGEFERAWDYFFDLFNVAMHKGAPIWTDDRATRAFSTEEPFVPRFGTDALLAYLHSVRHDQLASSEWIRLMERLIQSGVLSLPIDAQYLALLVKKAGQRNED